MRKEPLPDKVRERYRTEPTREALPIYICKGQDLEERKARLPEAVRRVMFEDGTEPAFSHPYHELKEHGIYHCRTCGSPLFGWEAKFDSGTGWPSFYAPLHPRQLDMEYDFIIGLPRVAVTCGCCGGHPGHVFEDGPKPTGLRFCMNGTALEFREEKEEE